MSDPRRYVVIGGGLAGIASAVWPAEAGTLSRAAARWSARIPTRSAGARARGDRRRLPGITTEQWFDRVGMPAEAHAALWDRLALGIALRPAQRPSVPTWCSPATGPPPTGR
ncbi:hypothetical protein IU427_21765 [Nocardia beijingensis]|uniref:hypothetical protein n=1 Tax=Nocardia beijingensis TaxID=95162 RepID=UPI0018949FE2|nr:hypothetical protein [Nocardia beijingensis]MBF6467795.1 hypothetical protein [Nocardia beijingensis]